MTDQEAQKLAEQLREYMLDHEEKHCLCCLGSMNKSQHSLTSGMVSGLMKFANYCIRFDKREANPRKDLPTEFELKINEMTNWTKLRFFGLVAKYKENGIHKEGKWVVTRNGWAFLRGDLTVPKFVRTFRNKIVEKSEERLAFYDIYGSQPVFPNREDLFCELAEGEDFDIVKTVQKKVRKKKGACPIVGCDGMMKKKMIVEIVNQLARPTLFMKCDKCEYEENYE